MEKKLDGGAARKGIAKHKVVVGFYSQKVSAGGERGRKKMEEKTED